VAGVTFAQAASGSPVATFDNTAGGSSVSAFSQVDVIGSPRTTGATLPPPGLPEFPFGAALPIALAGLIGLGYVGVRRRRLHRVAFGKVPSLSNLQEAEQC
jgi:hypothetical protein